MVTSKTLEIPTLKKIKDKSDQAYLKSGADAEQSLSSIKMVKAFGQEQHEIQKFDDHLTCNQDEVKKVAYAYGFSQGLMDSVIQIGRSYSLLIGAVFVINGVSSNQNNFIHRSKI